MAARKIATAPLAIATPGGLVADIEELVFRFEE